jgi:hypothetical protein
MYLGYFMTIWYILSSLGAALFPALVSRSKKNLATPVLSLTLTRN